MKAKHRLVVHAVMVGTVSIGATLAHAKDVVLSCGREGRSGPPVIVKFGSDYVNIGGEPGSDVKIYTDELNFSVIYPNEGYDKWFISRVDGKARQQSYVFENGKTLFDRKYYYQCAVVEKNAF